MFTFTDLSRYSIKKKLNKSFICLFLLFAIAPNASPLSYAIQSKGEAGVDGTKNVF